MSRFTTNKFAKAWTMRLAFIFRVLEYESSTNRFSNSTSSKINCNLNFNSNDMATCCWLCLNRPEPGHQSVLNYYQSHSPRSDETCARRDRFEQSADLNFIGRCRPPDASREQVPFKFQFYSLLEAVTSGGCHLNFNFAGGRPRLRQRYPPRRPLQRLIPC